MYSVLLNESLINNTTISFHNTTYYLLHTHQSQELLYYINNKTHQNNNNNLFICCCCKDMFVVMAWRHDQLLAVNHQLLFSGWHLTGGRRHSDDDETPHPTPNKSPLSIIIMPIHTTKQKKTPKTQTCWQIISFSFFKFVFFLKVRLFFSSSSPIYIYVIIETTTDNKQKKNYIIIRHKPVFINLECMKTLLLRFYL